MTKPDSAPLDDSLPETIIKPRRETDGAKAVDNSAATPDPGKPRDNGGHHHPHSKDV